MSRTMHTLPRYWEQKITARIVAEHPFTRRAPFRGSAGGPKQDGVGEAIAPSPASGFLTKVWLLPCLCRPRPARWGRTGSRADLPERHAAAWVADGRADRFRRAVGRCCARRQRRAVASFITRDAADRVATFFRSAGTSPHVALTVVLAGRAATAMGEARFAGRALRGADIAVSERAGITADRAIRERGAVNATGRRQDAPLAARRSRMECAT